MAKRFVGAHIEFYNNVLKQEVLDLDENATLEDAYIYWAGVNGIEDPESDIVAEHGVIEALKQLAFECDSMISVISVD